MRKAKYLFSINVMSMILLGAYSDSLWAGVLLAIFLVTLITSISSFRKEISNGQ